MTREDEKRVVRQHRRIFKVSILRQLLTGGRTRFEARANGWSMINYRPCPTCHGNDRLSNVREGFAILQVHCDRCGEEFWA